MKLYEVLDFYKNVAGAYVSFFSIEHGDEIETFELDLCEEYFKYLDMTVSEVQVHGSIRTFKVLTPGVEE